MTVVVDGNKGVSTPSGSAGTPAHADGSFVNGVYFPTATSAAIATNGAQAIAIDSAQVVTHNAATTLKGNINCITPSTTTALYQYWSNGSINVAAVGGYSDSLTAGHLEFYTATGSVLAEAARFDSSGNFIHQKLIATSAAAPTIASAATIAPTTPIVFVSGVTSISTITPPLPISSGGGQITIIPTGIFTTLITGNIAVASTSVVSKALIMTYDATTAKWYPSY